MTHHDESVYPMTRSMSKLNSKLQASGEAAYVLDQPFSKDELHGVLITSTLCNCRIDSIDTSIADSMPGVVRIIFAKDLPGPNLQAPADSEFGAEILFAEDYINYTGEPIGMVVAETYYQAVQAAKAVKITYKERKKPILSMKQAIEVGSFNSERPGDIVKGDAVAAINNAAHVITGEDEIGAQFHIYMESQVSVCKPTEDGVDVDSSTQHPTLIQYAISYALGLKNVSNVNVRTKQVGGGYGGKMRCSTLAAVAAAVGCKLVNKPVRVALDLNTTLETLGKRAPW